MWWKVGSLAAVLLLVGVLIVVAHNLDQRKAEEALLLLADPRLADRAALEEAYLQARARALSIRFSHVRGRTLADLQKVYDDRHRMLDEAETLARQALLLVNHRHASITELRTSMLRAEEIAARIRVPGQLKSVRTSIARIFEEQKQLIAEEERLRAEAAAARRLEAEKLLYQAQQAAAESAAEAERQRIATAQYQSAAQYQSEPARPPESKDCCCKTKVDVGFIATKWEFQYKRLDKGKCTDPAWFDAHSEGWCVPDSYCY